MDDLDVALLLYLEDEQSSSEENRSEESELFKNRSSEGAFQILVCRHLHCNDEKFRQYFRLTPVLFDYVLNNIRVELTSKPYNRHKKPICPEEKLCILVRHLATGESFRSLAFQYRVSHSWISVILREVVEAIIKRMFHVVLPTPTMGQFQKVAQQYSTKWNFPNCIGAIDGKHIRIKAPKNSGSLFYNYKDYHSMVMLAVVDADCKFTAVDVGSYGREGDAGIYLKSEIGRRIKNNTFNVPPPKALPGTDTVIPHVIVGDEAFALHQNLMKPYPRQQSLHDASKAIYNYRLSRARRTTENAFGILCSYFRLFFRPISTAPETTEKNYNMCLHTAQHFA
ncbi:protein ALP1-like [Trichonephila clavipes]|nr:protein ALP1-like [Trichonephila clavipes]